MNKKILAAAILAFGLITSSAVFAQVTSTSGAAKAPTDAQLDTTGITFPIASLGGCADRASCRAYCNDLNNMTACVEFAQAHGLASKDEAAMAKKYILKVQNKETPGGCTNPDSCNQYCQSISHLNECLKFAKENGVSDDNVAEGGQVAAYLATGGKTPGGCDTKDACETYCKDFNHASECMAFAKNAGMLKRIANDQGMPEGQFEKLLQLTQDGQAPGGCKSKDQCENYCKDSAHLNECLDFGVKAGFVSQEQADKVKAIGGKGPGGCSSEEACKVYCNEPANAAECFKFGEENGFISPEDVKAAKDGIVQLKMGLSMAPPEVKACLNSVLGPDKIAEIQAGTFTPNQAIGEQLKQCGEKFKENFNPEAAFKNVPPAIAQCLQSKVGDVMAKIRSGAAEFDSNTADAFRVCVGQEQIMQGNAGGADGANMMRGAPPEIQKCISDKLGPDFIDKLQKGEAESSDVQDKMKDCFKNFAPQGGMMQGGGFAPGIAPSMSSGVTGSPDKLLECAKGKVSAEVYAKIMTGEVPDEARAVLMQCAGGAGFQIPSQGGTETKRPPEYMGPPIKVTPGENQVPPSGSGAGVTPPQGMMPQVDCAQFAAVPSCSYVPGAAKDICEKCKGQ